MTAEPPKKKLNRADFMFSQKKDEKMMKIPGQIDGRAFNIRYLEDCEASVFDNTAQVNVDQCKNCKLIIGPSKASVFVRDCENCTIYVACQ